MTELFRPEALQAQQQQALGRILIARPLALGWLTLGAAVLAGVVIAFLVFAEYTRKAQVPGVLVPDRGLIRVVPAAAGTVLERLAIEGQAVRAGDLLFVLAQDRATRDDATQGALDLSMQQQRRSLEQAARQQRALAAAREAAVARRLQVLQTELAQLDAQIELQARRLALAQRAYERLQSLQDQSFISEAQVQAGSEDVLATQAQAQALARQRAGLERERATLEGERDALPLQLDAALSGIDGALAELARDSAEQQGVRRIEMRAPQDGTVSAVLADPGQSVAPPAALASLVPAGSALQAHLYAPSRAIGFVRPHQRVRLRFEAYPYAKYGHRDAHVLRVSHVPLAASEQAGLALPATTLAAAAGEPLFRITVALEPATGMQDALALSAGMRLQADVMLERRRLIEWLFEPLIGLRERL